jgi:hypothetical protein
LLLKAHCTIDSALIFMEYRGVFFAKFSKRLLYMVFADRPHDIRLLGRRTRNATERRGQSSVSKPGLKADVINADQMT